ncbi:hypothetical protein Ddc_15029 [Ditylenchus destructor]|nr:hypothetical protein Ddc_15029 [Ditylenchus destructor]
MTNRVTKRDGTIKGLFRSQVLSWAPGNNMPGGERNARNVDRNVRNANLSDFAKESYLAANLRQLAPDQFAPGAKAK